MFAHLPIRLATITALAILVSLAATTVTPASAITYSNCGEVRTTGTSNTTGPGALMIANDLDELTDNASTVVEGTVVSFQSCHTSENPGYITFVTVAVDDALKTEDGDDSVNSVRIAVDGGVVDGIGMAAGTSPEFAAGERVVVFLERTHQGETVLSDDYQSKLSVRADGTIEGHDTTISEVEAAVQAASEGDLPDSEDPLAGQPGIIESAYTKTGPWIHNNIHPVTVNINASDGKPSQLSTTDARLAIINSFKTWQLLPDNYIGFGFANTTRRNTQSACEGKFDVTWGIDEAHGSSTLAVTYTCYQGENTIDADIEIDTNHWGSAWRTDGSGSCASSKVDLETVMLHESGHFIGLGHPSANNCQPCPVMNASYGGVQRNACADDQAGAKSLYPLGGGDLAGVSGILTATSTGTTIDLAWQDVSAEQGFEIWRAAGLCILVSDGDFELHNTIKDNVTTYSDSNYGAGLPEGQPFCYKVRSVNTNGNSAFGPTAQGVLGELPTPEPTAEPTATPTAAPTAAPTATPHPTASPPPGPTATPTPTPSGNSVKGDVDCDQQVTAMDSLAILTLQASVSSADCVQNADYDCSGAVDAADAIAVLMTVSGITQPADAC